MNLFHLASVNFEKWLEYDAVEFCLDIPGCVFIMVDIFKDHYNNISLGSEQ